MKRVVAKGYEKNDVQVRIPGGEFLMWVFSAVEFYINEADVPAATIFANLPHSERAQVFNTLSRQNDQ